MKARQITVLLSGCVLFISLPAVANAQQTSQSLADAARKVKEQQKQAPQVKTVWTNDNLPTGATVSVVGPAPQQANATQPNAPAENAAPEDTDTERAKLSAELDQAKKQLESGKTDLDLAQREYKLDSDEYYAAPDYADNEPGKAKLSSDKSQVEAKQQAVDEAQKKTDQLQKEIDSLDAKPKS